VYCDKHSQNRGRDMVETIDTLVEGGTYFVSEPSVVLRETSAGSGKLNHLLLGDWLKYIGPTHVHEWKTRSGKSRSATYAFVQCRGDKGWLKIEEFDKDRALEVNFVDIGQGDGCHIVTPDDKVLLIDAGISDNMERFLSWRYNLRGRNVEGAKDFDPTSFIKKPWKIDYVVMSHPDQDHYGGFEKIFKNPKLSFDKVYHNGIVERPKEQKQVGVEYDDDLGGKFSADGESYLYDYVTSATALRALVNRHPKTNKKLVKTFRALFKNTPKAKVKAVGVNMSSLNTPKSLDGFGEDQKFSLQILGPIRERKSFNGSPRTTLRELGSEGVTKNGHSIIFKARYGHLKLLLGGDLNSQSQNFLLQRYADLDQTPEKIEKAISKLKAKPQPLNDKNQLELDELEQKYVHLESVGEKTFGVDVAKACHHGSQHILDSFIRSVNAVATVISSGDNESHSHPRPDALGAYGRYGRGHRPLIFSTELARSTHEFTPQLTNYLALRGITLQIEAETDKRKKAALLATLESKRDRNVAVYGMITLRALGDKVIIAQKLEVARSESQKWDIYELHYDSKADHFSYSH